ncbi:Zn-dependent hydrolase (beta-lactamase superfamily) [Lachnospiraceae bacterium TWA4]|nr:Zn-dependent hydrolase (beta-lactamase superfamily) [Lachnospiraceae bacterium TWA4]
MRFMSIASGSSGNCIYVGSDKTHLLIDTGISKKRVEEGLKQAELTGNDIDAILVTHEHSDHIKGLGVFLRKYQVPVYSAAETLEEIKKTSSIGKLPEELLIPINSQKKFSIGDLQILPIETSHDAIHPLCYRVDDGKSSAAVVTDLGEYDEKLINKLLHLDGLLIESNHDVRMLQTGPYPYYLKQRILGQKGHLSNESCGKLLNYLLHDQMKEIFLGHLSDKNNLKELASLSVKTEIDEGFCQYKSDDFPIHIAKRQMPSKLVNI